MSSKLIVRPVVPLAGGATGVAYATLTGKKNKLLYGVIGAGLAWAGAAALILRAASEQGVNLTPTQATQLAGFIQDREQQKQLIPSHAVTDRVRIEKEIEYLKTVLSKGKYHYANGKALKVL